MRTGKLQEAQLVRSVLRQLDKEPNLWHSRYGADSAAASGTMVCTVVSAVPGFEDRPSAFVTAAANNLAVAGAVPRSLLVSLTVPEDWEESRIRGDMAQLARAARETGMEILGGHTQVSRQVLCPQYSLTGIGETSEADYRGDAVLRPGQDLVLTGWIALGGTAAIARREEQRLKERYPFTMIDRAKAYEKQMSVVREARAITHFGACAMHDLSQGGVLGALWEMAERADVGLEVDLRKIPVRQETIEICEYFDINPYYLYSAGAVLVGTDQAEALVRTLDGLGIPAAVIGRVTDKKERIIRNGEDVRYLDRPQQEEWYRVFEKQNSGEAKNERTDFNIS